MSQGGNTEQRMAAWEALEAFQNATEERRRAEIVAYVREGDHMTGINVTEYVVSLLDMITTSMDWGSDFWTDTDLPSFIELCKLLKVDTNEMVGTESPNHTGHANGGLYFDSNGQFYNEEAELAYHAQHGR